MKLIYNTFIFVYIIKLKQMIYLPFLASSSHCLVINKYLGDSGQTGSKINCNMAGHIANPENVEKNNQECPKV